MECTEVTRSYEQKIKKKIFEREGANVCMYVCTVQYRV